MEDVPDVEDPFYEIERILRWRKIKQDKKIFKEYLVLWKGFPVEEASRVQANQFSQLGQLRHYLEKDQPLEEEI